MFIKLSIETNSWEVEDLVESRRLSLQAVCDTSIARTNTTDFLHGPHAGDTIRKMRKTKI